VGNSHENSKNILIIEDKRKSMHINEEKGKGHYNYFFKNGVENNTHN
jgi:hypothetical protein